MDKKHDSDMLVADNAITPDLKELRKLTESLPIFPKVMTTFYKTQQYHMDEGTCFSWLLYEDDQIKVFRWFNSRGKSPSHQKKHTEILFLFHGEATITLHDKDIIMHPLDVIKISANTPHSIVFLHDTIYYSLIITDTFIQHPEVPNVTTDPA